MCLPHTVPCTTFDLSVLVVPSLCAGSVRGMSGEGMPMFRHNEIRGNLYIRIDVEFPENQFLEEDDLKVRV